jgi:hypothetical protein
MNVFVHFWLLLVLGCKVVKVSEREIKSIRVESKFPFYAPDTSFVLHNWYDVAYREHMTLYKFRYAFDSIMSDGSPVTEWRNNFFVFEKDSLFGWGYYPAYGAAGRFRIDSFLKKNRFDPFTLDSSIYPRADSSIIADGKDLVKIYKSIVSEKFPENFTIYFSYSDRFKNIPEVLSRNMDRAEGKKLYQVRVVGHGAFYARSDMTVPGREFLWSLQEAPAKFNAEALAYFNKYEADQN